MFLYRFLILSALAIDLDATACVSDLPRRLTSCLQFCSYVSKWQNAYQWKISAYVPPQHCMQCKIIPPAFI
jgi:hypothetical protein